MKNKGKWVQEMRNGSSYLEKTNELQRRTNMNITITGVDMFFGGNEKQGRVAKSFCNMLESSWAGRSLVFELSVLDNESFKLTAMWRDDAYETHPHKLVSLLDTFHTAGDKIVSTFSKHPEMKNVEYQGCEFYVGNVVNMEDFLTEVSPDAVIQSVPVH